MGEPMAMHIVAAGYPLTVAAHRQRAALERLLAQGAKEAASVAATAAQVDILLVCVPDDAAMEQVMLGENGVAKGGQRGLIVVDTSTVSPTTSRQVAAQLAEHGITLLDAPVSGGPMGAEAGTLAVMVGGPEAAFERVRPVLEAIGKNVTYVGENGTALVAKLANNLVVAATLAASAEALTMAAAAGVDTGVVQRIISQSTGSSFVNDRRLPASMLIEDLTPLFKLWLMRKDVGLALDFGQDLGVPMFMSGLAHQLYIQAEGMGLGELDTTAISRVYTTGTGISLHRREAGDDDADAAGA
jgi:3-hydroxyisobutyrate dehydrogenase-like beta-hydroxyacid dehydrogenase